MLHNLLGPKGLPTVPVICFGLPANTFLTLFLQSFTLYFGKNEGKLLSKAINFFPALNTANFMHMIGVFIIIPYNVNFSIILYNIAPSIPGFTNILSCIS